jgi:hypothetical protein
MAHKPTKERYFEVTLYECDPNLVLEDEDHKHKVLYKDEAIAHDPSYVQDRARNLGWLASRGATQSSRGRGNPMNFKTIFLIGMTWFFSLGVAYNLGAIKAFDKALKLFETGDDK